MATRLIRRVLRITRWRRRRPWWFGSTPDTSAFAPKFCLSSLSPCPIPTQSTLSTRTTSMPARRQPMTQRLWMSRVWWFSPMDWSQTDPSTTRPTWSSFLPVRPSTREDSSCESRTGCHHRDRSIGHWLWDGFRGLNWSSSASVFLGSLVVVSWHAWSTSTLSVCASRRNVTDALLGKWPAIPTQWRNAGIRECFRAYGQLGYCFQHWSSWPREPATRATALDLHARSVSCGRKRRLDACSHSHTCRAQ